MRAIEYIDKLQSCGYVAYALTLTFTMNEYEREKYSDDALYRVNRLRQLSVTNENLAAKCEHAADKYAKFMINEFLLIIENMTQSIVGGSLSNIGRPNKLKINPIIYGRMEQMPRYNRREALENERGSSNISPLHYHAVIFVSQNQTQKMDSLLGHDTFEHFSENRKVQSSDLQKIYDLKGWGKYMHKDEHSSFYTPYAYFYPGKFYDQPNQFVLDATGINLDLAA